MAVYAFFNKNWTNECREHATIAEGAPLVANITEQFDETVEVAGTALRCHVAVLRNVAGPTLQQLLATPAKYALTPRKAAQIAVDLFEIVHLFAEHKRYHNDLHAGNIIVETLLPSMHRSAAIDAGVRAVAIDLGSILDANRSGDHDGRVLSDQHHVARHLAELANAVQLQNETDIEYRIAGTLRGLAEHLTPALEAQRTMTVDDALRALRNALSVIDEPWRQPMSLHRFAEGYNAQSLDSWHVPVLWFDPHNRWFKRTTARGPQVITGMRGCGKTMLLRALHFHARATLAGSASSADQILGRIRKDVFIGVYASCQKLLNPHHHDLTKSVSVTLPFERLYIAYLRDAIQVLRHLRSLDAAAVLGSIDALLRDALTPLQIPEIEPLGAGEEAFARFLVELQFMLADGTARCHLKMAPAEAFGHLAEVIKGSSPLFATKYILFLLDDVSTRYLHPDLVREVISQLLFQHSSCAFRITTEAQALQRVLLSPGRSVPADPNRDYEEFDLGNEVYRLLQEGSTRKSMEFVAEILRRRGRQFQDALYRAEPLDLLGDVSLEDIAGEIAAASVSSPERKRVYRGLRALQAVCVGDIGDVVRLYERILQRADPSERPVPSEKQSDCFLERSADLMHQLNRRDQHTKGLALAFAQASGELLQRSAKSDRLRQYTKLYVRVDAGPEFEDVATQILALLDAGVFVYDGGVPRTKTRDDDPVLQFKLSYRKLLGLASYIGIADRDRFELSGDNLRRWLQHPEQAKDILVESVAKGKRRTRRDKVSDEATADAAAVVDNRDKRETAGLKRKLRRKPSDQMYLTMSAARAAEDLTYAPALGIRVADTSLVELAGRKIQTIVLGLGFEDRAVASAERLLRAIRPERVVLLQYDREQGRRICEVVDELIIPAQKVENSNELARAIKETTGDVVIDSTGLVKPVLFVAVRDVLRRLDRVTIAYTLAKDYYPRNEDLRARGVTVADLGGDVLGLLEDVLMGESGPYDLVSVHDEPAEPERSRSLIASASPKNDRLLYLLDKRTYDAARIFVPPATSERRRVARASAELAASAAENVGMIEIDTNDIREAVRLTEAVYNDLYFRSGANVEIGLTGSKIHAVAFAALAAARRVSAAWYVSPEAFDKQRFTAGVGEMQLFDIVRR